MEERQVRAGPADAGQSSAADRSHGLEEDESRRLIYALSIARLADALGNSVLFVIIPLFVEKIPSPAFDLPTPLLTGFLISLYGIVNALAQPFVGALSDRAARRKPFIQGGLLMMSAGTLGFAFAGRYLDLIGLRVVQGIGFALTVPTSLALMTAFTRQGTRGGSMAIYTTARLVGLSAGPLIGGWLHDRVGFNAAFYVGAGLILIGTLLVQLWVRDDRAAAGTLVARPFRLIDRSLLTAPLLSVGAATFVMASSFTLVVPLEAQFNQRLGTGAFGFGIAFSALMLSRLLFQIPFGRLSDRIGRKPLVIGGLLLMTPAVALMGITSSVFALAATRSVLGIGSAAVAAPAFALAADLSSAGGEGRQMSVVSMGFGLGIAAGPLISGILGPMSFELPFLVGAVLTLAGAGLVQTFVPGAAEST